MAKIILCIDDSRNIKLWLQVAELAEKVGIKVCLAADIMPLNKNNWNDLKEFSDLGHEICSHTVNHIKLDNCELIRVRRELLASKIILDDILEKDCDTVVYPFGGVNQDIIRISKECGYKFGRSIPKRKFRMPKKFEDTNKMLISSVNMPRDIGYNSVNKGIYSITNLVFEKDLTACFYAHGEDDFTLSDWDIVINTIFEFYDKGLEILTFRELI